MPIRGGVAYARQTVPGRIAVTIWRGMICLSLAVDFEEDRARLGLAAAADGKPWERRLADLAQALANCAASYFDPDMFRRNLNHFLTTGP